MLQIRPTLPDKKPANHIYGMHVLGIVWGINMEEELCHIEIQYVPEKKKYFAKVQSDLGGLREYNGATMSELLRTLTIELQEEFDNVVLE